MAYIPLTSQATLLTSVRRRRTLPGTINVLVKEVRGLGLNMELLDAEEE